MHIVYLKNNRWIAFFVLAFSLAVSGCGKSDEKKSSTPPASPAKTVGAGLKTLEPKTSSVSALDPLRAAGFMVAVAFDQTRCQSPAFFDEVPEGSKEIELKDIVSAKEYIYKLVRARFYKADLLSSGEIISASIDAAFQNNSQSALMKTQVGCLDFSDQLRSRETPPELSVGHMAALAFSSKTGAVLSDLFFDLVFRQGSEQMEYSPNQQVLKAQKEEDFFNQDGLAVKIYQASDSRFELRKLYLNETTLLRIALTYEMIQPAVRK